MEGREYEVYADPTGFGSVGDPAALTVFDKSKHDEVLPKILERLDFIMSLGPDDEIVTTFKQYNPFYASTGKSSKTVMG